MLTLEEIARLSGTSRSTVSRVINNEAGVSEKTRQKVMAVIQEYNFQPNRAARILAGGRTRVLGLVIPQAVTRLFSDPYFSIFIQGVTTACNSRDYSVMLWLAEPEYERRVINQILYNGLIDGVIVSSAVADDPLVGALRRSHMAFVLVGRPPDDESLCYVDVDNKTSAQEATSYLLRSGHRRVGTITGPLNTIVGVDRRDGYLQALHENDFPTDEKLIVEGDFSEEGGYAAARLLLDHQPDGIFAASDLMALGALRALAEAGLHVPEQVAVVGFDDIPAAVRSHPQLTTVRQPIIQLGSSAVETLISCIETPGTEARQVLLPTELIIRQSA
jgi:LacI family transcriptional regulator, galactose operon repressor